MRFLVPGKKPCISKKTVPHEVGKTQNIRPKIRIKCPKFSRSAYFTQILAKAEKICISQVFLETIQNRVSPRSVHLEAAYLKALLHPY